jgi:DDE superfamily endonuclease
MADRGYPLPVKFLRSLALVIAHQRSSPSQIPAVESDIRPPGKNLPQSFYQRHPELKSKRVEGLDWARHDHHIYDKVRQWFAIIGPELSSPDIVPENIYNLDETGVLLSMLSSLKVLVGKNDLRNYRGAGVKRTMVTAIECISADGRFLPSLIIWPASIHRSTWTIHPTPGWHFACLKSGYTDKEISLSWVQRVFDPSTRPQANGRPRILINDGFGTHESVEILQFCIENNIVLCRLPSHTSYKLQPCDVGDFGPLKTAYREQVEQLYRGGANTVGKQLLYSPARDTAFTVRNIKSGWSKAGLVPFNPDRVLQGIQKPQTGFPGEPVA